MSYKRKMTREVRVGDVKIGGNNPISVQSMTNTDTRDVEKTVAQIKRLEEVGCDIVRVAVVDMDAAKSISKIKEQVNIPIIADIHFDYRLALEAIEQGVDGIRINPGNIGSIERVKAVVEKCKERDLKIRIGVNGGSLEKELLKDPKELAEHNMLVDLGRNDLGKISKFGTVKVDKYHQILKFSHVMHIGSTVTGEIREDKTALDAVDAVLPAGTLSGAPKIRAMQIINELENNKRGIYGGAVGYIDLTGNLDTCIAIRLAFKKHGKVYVRSGAGIVADSIPAKEHRECINKAKAVVTALKQSVEEM